MTLTPEQNYEDTYANLAVLKKLKGNMGLFGRICLPTAIKKEVPPFHHEIYSMLRDLDKKRVFATAPRASAKSTVFSLVYPLWRAMFKSSTEEVFIVLVSESASQSINFLSRIKYHLNNTKALKDIFGDFGEKTSKRWTQDDIVLANNTRIVAVGTGQRVRGFIEGDTRPTEIIIDDFESELNAGTPERRTKNRQWILNAVFPSLSDEGRILMVGTPISEDCFLYYAKGSGIWEYVWKQICEDLDAAIEGRAKDAGLLWAERFPIDRILSIKKEYENSGNLHGFFQEYMCIAQNPAEAPFQQEYFRYFEHELIKTDGGWALKPPMSSGDEELIPIDIYLGVDPASSLSFRADYFVIAAVGVDAAGNRYLIDLFRSRVKPSDQPAKIIEWWRKYKPRKTKIETIAYQEALRDGTRALMKEQNIYIPGLEKGVKPRTSKSERLLSLVPFFSTGKFFLRRTQLTAQAEFLAYPRGKHDDIMDAIWTACHGMINCRRKRVANVKKTEQKTHRFVDWMVL
jgi:predicted phage terminase large subunit-like protein